MRTSQRALLGGVIVVMALLVAGVFGIRSVVSDFIGSEARADSSLFGSATLELSPNLVDFDKLLLRSAWEVEIVRGDEWRVDISVPAEVEDSVRVGVNNGRLVLEVERSDRPWWFNPRNRGNHARIVMPALTDIEVAGAANISFAGFRGDSLAIRIAGAANVEPRDSRFANLDLTIGGAGNVDFNDVIVTNARVSLSGASNVELNMGGGELTGQVSGIGRLAYAGDVAREDVTVSGFSTVDRTRR